MLLLVPVLRIGVRTGGRGRVGLGIQVGVVVAGGRVVVGWWLSVVVALTYSRINYSWGGGRVMRINIGGVVWIQNLIRSTRITRIPIAKSI